MRNKLEVYQALPSKSCDNGSKERTCPKVVRKNNQAQRHQVLRQPCKGQLKMPKINCGRGKLQESTAITKTPIAENSNGRYEHQYD